MPYKKCKMCNKEFYASPNKGKRGVFCSRECYNKDRKKDVGSIYSVPIVGKR